MQEADNNSSSAGPHLYSAAGAALRFPVHAVGKGSFMAWGRGREWGGGIWRPQRLPRDDGHFGEALQESFILGVCGEEVGTGWGWQPPWR